MIIYNIGMPIYTVLKREIFKVPQIKVKKIENKTDSELFQRNIVHTKYLRPVSTITQQSTLMKSGILLGYFF